MNYKYFTSESVCAGHPDKICDQISDAVLDACLRVDKYSHTGVECLVTTNRIIVSGEVKTKARPNFEKIARKVVKDLGYTRKIYNFDYKTAKVDVLVHQQSADISKGVDIGGAGDQGMMFGYACKETKELMPLPIMLAHDLTRKMDEVKTKALPYLRPDGKSQVVVSYNKGRPVAVESVVLAVPHDPKIKKDQLKNDLFKKVVTPVLKKYSQKNIKLSKLIVNGTGDWEIGGPYSDMGETGRKIVVDSYGGMARVGGGCFSGKCPTKVDRTGAYGARFIAKNIVAANLADRCEVQVSYVIGHKDPIAKAVETFGTGKKSQKQIEDFAWSVLDLSVLGIVKGLNLLKPIYQKTAAYGHFGRKGFPWEKIVS
ncbi:methionine adenosyltransferase [Candidatus Beckwithbacteria bacterium CG10_big_fil_rev_8_21_14_0_10_34_10]|uniref:Methionine adenosyltransferase n=1 Tax=Candidatus Beckwithbacteria bacterium CG10_big_fil_rev_8_21_14_0_10_34_10 TaxID=1974495 RepID=A0A2H0W9K1_9BACT|nr:MAG: methionine adenosyltransferase [Candidatus Beckwithbacteria bacterium CG10_big_fil_rev_8_21_14_0_10_34_10]